MTLPEPVRLSPALSFLPKPIREPQRAWLAVLVGWLTAIIPSLLLAALVSRLFPQLPGPKFDMEEVELGFSEEALHAVAKKAIERKTGARGLRSILEGILLDTMFDLPSMEGVDEVHVDKDVIDGRKDPVRVYAKKDKTASSGDAA